MVTDILDWAEVWALLIPITIMCFKRARDEALVPVKYYLIIGLFIYLLIDLISNQKKLGLHLRIHENGLLYNLQSITQFIFFSYFFLKIKPGYQAVLKKTILVLFILFLPFHFSKFPIQVLSSVLHGLEVGLLLIFCLLYYFQIMKQDNLIVYDKRPEFWVVTGLSVYIIVSFFILLLYNDITAEDKFFAIKIWSWHNIAFVLMCVFIAKGLYQSYLSNKKSNLSVVAN